jgi:hypothetical protein
MTNTETAEYIRDNYSRTEYLLLTLVSCSLLMNKVVGDSSDLPPELEIINDSLNSVRESLNEKELSVVSVMMNDIDRLSNGTPEG